ncbi:MAG: hypothetical protein U0Z17_08420 [Bacteroidales bacterium]
MRKTISRFVLLASLAVLLLTSTSLHAQNGKDLEVGITEHLDQYVPDDIVLTDHTGKQVNLKQIINKTHCTLFCIFQVPRHMQPAYEWPRPGD